MGTVEPKDPLKGNDWKDTSKSVIDNSAEPAVKKRLPKKVRQIPEFYFLPRRSIPSAIAFYGTWIVAGVGAGMLAEIWINKKVKGGWRRHLGVWQIDAEWHLTESPYFIYGAYALAKYYSIVLRILFSGK